MNRRSSKTVAEASPARGRPRLLPSLQELRDPLQPFLIPLLLLVAGRILAWWALPLASEDAYITFRFARNLAAGNGLVYNPGEPVFGFSSPLWTIWNALGFAIFKDPIAWSRVWGIIADAATLITFGSLILRHAGRNAAWVFTFFIAAWPTFAANAVSGLETGVLLALIGVSAVAAASASLLAGPALAALALSRPEGVIAALVIAIGVRWRDRFIAAALLAIGLVALFAYFGTIVPQSVAAKSSLYGTPGPWAGRVWWDWLVPIVMGRWPTFGETRLLAVLTIVLAPAFAMGAVELWRARTTALARAAAACMVVWLGYSLLGVAYFWWYMAVPLGGVAIAAALGFPKIVRGRAVAIAGVLFVLSLWSIAGQLYRGRAADEARHFGHAADVLRAHAHPGDKVMLEPIGLIGYTNAVLVIDEVGLVSPEVAARRLQGPGWYADIVATHRPQWLILRAGVLRSGQAFAGTGTPFRNSVERDSMLARYAVVDQGDDASGDRALWVWRRVRE